MNTPGTGKNDNIDCKQGTEKGKPPHKKATKASQFITSQNKGDKSHKGKSDTLLGDPMVNIKKSINKAKATEQKDTIGVDDIGIFEFIFEGLSTMAELTKMDNRQPVGKIKSTDKMVMMPSLFDGMKPETSKQHYKRFNLYINFQTKSGHLTDPVGEAVDLFKHTLDKTALVWFQTNRSKFKDFNMLKTMFLK